MIDAKDLRVGDWVYDGDRTRFPMFIHTINEGYVLLDFQGNEGDFWEVDPEDLQGIPLTDDMLLKMGFECFDRDIWSLGLDHCHVAYTTTSGFLTIERYERSKCVSRCTCLGVRYVHEIQNLYRCIVGTNMRFSL